MIDKVKKKRKKERRKDYGFKSKNKTSASYFEKGQCKKKKKVNSDCIHTTRTAPF